MMRMKIVRRKSPQPVKRPMYHRWKGRTKRQSWRNTHNRSSYKRTQKCWCWVSGRMVVIIRPEDGKEKKTELCLDDPLDSENDSSMPRSFLLLVSKYTTRTQCLSYSLHLSTLSPYLVPNSCYTDPESRCLHLCSPDSCWSMKKANEWVRDDEWQLPDTLKSDQTIYVDPPSPSFLPWLFHLKSQYL